MNSMNRVLFVEVCVFGIIAGAIIGIVFFGVYLDLTDAPKSIVTVHGFYRVPDGWSIVVVERGSVCHVVGVLNGSVKPEEIYNGFKKYTFLPYGNKTIVCDAEINPYTLGGPRSGLFYADYAVVIIRKEFPWGRFFWGSLAFALCGFLFAVVLLKLASIYVDECGGCGGGDGGEE